jgi:hypothetical protein
MEEIYSSETLGSLWNAWRYDPEQRIPHKHCREVRPNDEGTCLLQGIHFCTMLTVKKLYFVIQRRCQNQDYIASENDASSSHYTYFTRAGNRLVVKAYATHRRSRVPSNDTNEFHKLLNFVRYVFTALTMKNAVSWDDIVWLLEPHGMTYQKTAFFLPSSSNRTRPWDLFSLQKEWISE